MMPNTSYKIPSLNRNSGCMVFVEKVEKFSGIKTDFQNYL